MSASECADDYPVVAALNPHWRVIECRHGIQWWIVQRRGSPEKPRAADWRGRRYHRSKEALLISARTLCDYIEPSAWNILTALPERIVERDQVPS